MDVMFRIVPWAEPGFIALFSTECVAYMYPETFVAFMVLMEEIGRAWNGAGASRARPAWVRVSFRFLYFLTVVIWVIRERAYVVDEDIDSTQFFHRGCYCGVDGFVVAYVGCSVDDLTARRAGRLELLL